MHTFLFIIVYCFIDVLSIYLFIVDSKWSWKFVQWSLCNESFTRGIVIECFTVLFFILWNVIFCGIIFILEPMFVDYQHFAGWFSCRTVALPHKNLLTDRRATVPPKDHSKNSILLHRKSFASFGLSGISPYFYFVRWNSQMKKILDMFIYCLYFFLIDNHVW